MAPTRPGTAPPAQTLVDFGSLTSYGGGGGLPEGDYCLYFDVRMHQAINKQTGQARGQARLGVMVAAYDLHDPTAEPREQFYSMGRKAHLSFAPDPNTGKSVVAVPGGMGGIFNNKTNWFYLLKSLYDSGMPEGVFNNDFTAIDGVWAHVQHIPAPEERKSFATGAKTGDDESGGEEEFKGADTIAVVSAILEGGRPWEGTGGVPTAPVGNAGAPARPATQASAPPARPAPVAARPTAPAAPARPGVAPRPASAATPTAAPAMDEETLTQTVINAFGEVLLKPSLVKGGPKLTLRTETFKFLKDNAGEDTAQAVMNTIFASDDKLGAALNQVGFGIVGNRVQPQ